MNAVTGSLRALGRRSTLGALTLVFMTGCAGGPPAQKPSPADTETVDIGYGSVDKEQVTGSTATVVSNEVQPGRVASLAEMLSRVAGVRVIESPDGGISVRIRGSTSSFMSGQEPLFVVDGMVFQGGTEALRGLNPNIIASITVLKDAGSTAVYGSRGANGVILIKTKKGGA